MARTCRSIPDYPRERLAFMLDDTAAPVLVTQQELLGRAAPARGDTLCLDRDGPTIGDAAARPVRLPAPFGHRNLAYVIYTSGSTGTPKGRAW